jgi:hypothetical protein
MKVLMLMVAMWRCADSSGGINSETQDRRPLHHLHAISTTTTFIFTIPMLLQSSPPLATVTERHSH